MKAIRSYSHVSVAKKLRESQPRLTMSQSPQLA